MNKVYNALSLAAIGVAVGLTIMFIGQTVDAWHRGGEFPFTWTPDFQGNGECVKFFQEEFGNTNKEAKLTCKELIGH